MAERGDALLAAPLAPSTTIRRPESEIWVTFNPELDTDETYKRFVVRPPSSAIVRKIGWQENPWYPSTLLAEMNELRTGYRTEGLLDVHYVTDDDIARERNKRASGRIVARQASVKPAV